MNRMINIVVILLVLGITGWIRMPYEQKLSEDLHRLRLVPPRLSLSDRNLLKQKAFVATYGSLRPTIAAFMSVQTTNYHSDQQWDKVEKSFNEILLLDPYNYYYWDTASWHMASNAAIDKQYEPGLTEVGKKHVFKKYIQKGRDIVNKSIIVNPEDPRFFNLKARLESNRHRDPDYAKAIETYRALLKIPNVSKKITRETRIAIQYCYQQLPEFHQESYEHALTLFQLGDTYHVPTVQNEVFIGQNHPLNTITKRLSLLEIYGSEKLAYQDLTMKWKVRELGQKIYGVEEAIKELEDKFQIPQFERVLPYKPLFLKK